MVTRPKQRRNCRCSPTQAKTPTLQAQPVPRGYLEMASSARLLVLGPRMPDRKHHDHHAAGDEGEDARDAETVEEERYGKRAEDY